MADPRSEMLATFKLAWAEYIRIFKTESNVVRDVYNGRLKPFGKDTAANDSEFIRTPMTFRTNMLEGDFGKVADCFECCRALTCFVKYLACQMGKTYQRQHSAREICTPLILVAYVK